MEISNKWLDWGIHAVMQQIVTGVCMNVVFIQFKHRNT